MLNLHFNRDQKLELSKALFNLGNLCFSTTLLGQVVLSSLDVFIFLLGAISFAVFYTMAIIIIKQEIYMTIAIYYGTFLLVFCGVIALLFLNNKGVKKTTRT